MNNPSVVMEVPYAEMKQDTYDPSGWLSEMDFVCDGDREVCIVICTDQNVKPGQEAVKHVQQVEWDTLELQKPSWVSPLNVDSSKGSSSAEIAPTEMYDNGNVRVGNIVISKTEYAKAELAWLDELFKVFGWKA